MIYYLLKESLTEAIKIYKHKRAFTLIELIATIAILGILVLIATPKVLGYTEKAELTRIRHDVKVMEQEMDIALLKNKEDFVRWDDNGKDLGKLILSDKLYEKEGFAKSVEKTHLAKYYESTLSNPIQLGVGGDMYAIAAETDEDKEVDLMTSLGYKIIPAQYSSKINTELKGTFYSNDEGKVYYENDKALKSQKDESIKACDAPVAESLGYTFEIINGKGTITKYDHREQNIVIPTEFKVEVDGEEICEPVRVIGKAAFAYGPLKKLQLESVVIPNSVEKIEEGAFKDNNIPKITIPSSVKVVEDNILIGNNVSHIIVRGGESSPIKEIDYPNVKVEYNYGTPKDLDIIFDYNSGTIIDYSGTGGKFIEVPRFITQNGVNYPVKGIAKGAYQGEGLISVILPETLERIEDYAFSGNQLTGITIPNSVVHIGNYAFSFNERLIGGKMTPTMKTVIMNGIERFSQIDKSGNILENGLKVNLLDGKLALLDHIFVTSIGNKVEFIDDEESLPGEPEGNPSEPENPIGGQDGPIIFSGLGREAYDGNDETYVDKIGQKTLTWTGDLDNKEISIDYASAWDDLWSNNIKVSFYDDNGHILRSPSFPNSDSILLKYNKDPERQIVNIIVPTGAKNIKLFSNDARNMIYEITSPKELVNIEAQEITSSKGDNKITLSWPKPQRVIVIKDNLKLIDKYTDSYTDNSLQPESIHNYKILFFDGNGNGSKEFSEVTEKTNSRKIMFEGLDPKAWDNDKTTYVDNIGQKTLTWTGDLDNKEISIDYASAWNDMWSNNIKVSFYDDNGHILRSPSFPNSDSILLKYNRDPERQIVNIIVPTGAKNIKLFSNDARNKIYEITSPKELVNIEPQEIVSSKGDSKITLSWQKKQRVIIIKDNLKLLDKYTDSYTDNSLQPDSTHNYKVLFIDENGNGTKLFSEVLGKTNSRKIMFEGLDPKAWDNDKTTYVNNIGQKTLTWTGDLDNKKISIDYASAWNDMWSNNIKVSFYDDNGHILRSPSFPNSDSILLKYNRDPERQIVNIIVPTGAKNIKLFSNDSRNMIYEITVTGNSVID